MGFSPKDVKSSPLYGMKHQKRQPKTYKVNKS